MIFKFALSDDSNLKANGYTQEEEDYIYNSTLSAVLSNTRWYLDNLDKLPTYRLSWHSYNTKNVNIPSPLKFCVTKSNVKKKGLRLKRGNKKKPL